MSIKTLVVDDRAIIRAGIRHACAQDETIELIGESGTWSQAEQLIQTVAPDVIVIDMPRYREHREQIAALIDGQHSPIQVLVFGESNELNVAVESIHLGASGYLTEVADLAEITVGIRCVHAGRVFISHSNTHVHSPRMLVHSSRQYEPLSEREQEVVEWLAQGLTNKQVAEKLFLSVKTIETYRSRIMKKHDLKGRAEMMQFARRFISAKAS